MYTPEEDTEDRQEQENVNMFGDFVNMISSVYPRSVMPSGSYISIMLEDEPATFITNKDIEYVDVDASILLFTSDSDKEEIIRNELSGEYDGYDWLIERVGPVKIDNIFHGVGEFDPPQYKVAVLDNGNYWDVISNPQQEYQILLIEDFGVLGQYDYDHPAIIEIISGDFPPGGMIRI